MIILNALILEKIDTGHKNYNQINFKNKSAIIYQDYLHTLPKKYNKLTSNIYSIFLKRIIMNFIKKSLYDKNKYIFRLDKFPLYAQLNLL